MEPVRLLDLAEAERNKPTTFLVVFLFRVKTLVVSRFRNGRPAALRFLIHHTAPPFFFPEGVVRDGGEGLLAKEPAGRRGRPAEAAEGNRRTTGLGERERERKKKKQQAPVHRHRTGGGSAQKRQTGGWASLLFLSGRETEEEEREAQRRRASPPSPCRLAPAAALLRSALPLALLTALPLLLSQARHQPADARVAA
jgi:hypothetical protein